MKKGLKIIFLATALALTLSCAAACGAEDKTAGRTYDDGVVQAFRAVTAEEGIISQTATADAQKYLVTVVTPTTVYEYGVDAEFKVERAKTVAQSTPAALALEMAAEETDAVPPAETTPEPPADTTPEPAEKKSDLERALEEALRLSGIARENVVGLDFDRETYKGEAVFKVEIEDSYAEYTYILRAADLSLIESKSEMKHTMSAESGSYIGEARAKAIALDAVGIEESAAAGLTVKSAMSGGRRIYRVALEYETYRYEADVDALNGDIVKFSKMLIGSEVTGPAISGNITEEQAKQIALAFAFPEGVGETQVVFRKVKLDYDDGRFLYEVEFVANGDEYELEILASDGSVVDAEIEKAHDDIRWPQDSFLSREDVIRAVKTYLGDEASRSVIKEIDLTTEGGVYYYEVEVNTYVYKEQDGAPTDQVDFIRNRTFLVGAAGPVSGEVSLSEEEIIRYEESGMEGLIGEQKAIEIALSHFSLTEKEVRLDKVKLEKDDGKLIYEVEFEVKNLEYEVEIDARTGKVLDSEVSYD